MQTETKAADEFGNSSPYLYLLDWEWPEHIEALLRRLLFLSITEDKKELDTQEIAETDYLAARLSWLISVYPETNPTILHTFAQQQPAAFLQRIAENPSTLPKTLTCLSDSSSPQVRSAVAENINTDEAVLRKLAKDESVDVRYTMAENHNLDPSILELLSNDDNCYVANRAHKTLSRLTPREASIFPMRRNQTQTQERRAAQI